jgi:2-polyprenyl-6-methoxyphenol hydroxylase-like FAD-dependent oxidoreductase
MDVFWFKLSKSPKDGQIEGATGNIRRGTMFVQIDRGDYWQLGIVIKKGSYQELHKKGIEAFREEFAAVAPVFKERVSEIKDWHDIGYFMIECGRVKTWYKDGLLLIGDAAHIMSPVGGVGINYAIQDAVETANILTKPLQMNSVSIQDLAKVQKKRLFSTKLVQWFQYQAHQRIVAQAIQQKEQFQPPWFIKLPGVRKLLTYFLAFGFWRAHVEEQE